MRRYAENTHIGKQINKITAAAAKSLQSCPTLCDPIDGSPPGSPVPGILQARTLEWVAISFSNAWKWKMKVKSLSRVQLLATPWTAAFQAPPSMGFSRQEFWSGMPLPSPKITADSVKCHEEDVTVQWDRKWLVVGMRGSSTLAGSSGKSSLKSWHLSLDLKYQRKNHVTVWNGLEIREIFQTKGRANAETPGGDRAMCICGV